MTLLSSLVTAKRPSEMEQYKLTINSKVNDNEIVLNAKAKDQYDKIYAAYTNLNKRFKNIADQYDATVTKQYIEGATITKEIRKVGKNCEEQGKYCINRQKNLKTYYKEAKVAKSYQDLEDEVKRQADLIAKLTSRIEALEGK